MNIKDLTTPSFILDLDILEKNISEVQSICDSNGKELWPMTKTHKSTEIAKIQLEAGAKGFLVGTLDEALLLANAGIENITYAYPIMGEKNLERVIEISKIANLYLSIDCIEQAEELDYILKANDTSVKVLIIINSGLNRFGVEPDKAGKFYESIKKFNNIEIMGISTHPGQVYGVKNIKEVKKVADEEISSIKIAVNKLNDVGYKPKMIATGSTPTMFIVAEDENINILRPGNYVFYDNIQMSLGLVDETKCALSILATVVSNPQKGLFIIDAGSKCLGLDKGAHGNALIEGFGYIVNHPELIIEDLSEEVAKIRVKGETKLKIGDNIKIIPNHSCSSANFTSYLIGYRDDIVEKIIEIDMRGGALKKCDI